MSVPTVSLVIPGRNCAATLRPCLDAVCAIAAQEDSPLREILFVDDGSTDDTPAIADAYEHVTRIAGEGTGPAAARNLGWRRAAHPLIWFVDSDCVAEPDALELLIPHLEDPAHGGVSGSYGNERPRELLPCLIHEEIIERHRRMKPDVDFLATFNVLYRRAVLEQVGGFDTRYLKGQDAELSFRVLDAGYGLRFEPRSRVGHYHENGWGAYLRTQRQQGYWRVWLHLSHRGRAGGDSYSSFIDHIQPPLAMLVLASLPLLLLPYARWFTVACVVLLAAAQLPMTWRITRRCGHAKYLMFGVMSFIRAFWRGIGLSLGTVHYMLRRDARVPRTE
ncbi:MAG: glycosyltransferase [Phycisphaerales bacterium]|nr:glycosyltransferase [Phycisphaerales bacterium]